MAKEKSSNPKELKDWTIMVYMAGDNDLSEEFVWSIMEMFKIGATAKIAVFIEYDSCSPRDRKRFQIPLPKRGVSSSFDGVIEKGKPVESLSRSTPVGPDDALALKLTDFLTTSINRYDAARHLLILAGHGGGAISEVLLKDRHPVSFLTIPRLKKILQDTASAANKKIDIIGLDSCVMNTLEVAYGLAGQATYFVASQGLEPRTGWPLYRILEKLNQRPGTEPEDLARFLVQTHTGYYANYEEAGISTDLAACNLTRLTALTNAVKGLAAQLKTRLDKEENQPQRPLADALVLAHWKAQSYKSEEYVDLWDFCNLLYQCCVDKEIQTACRNVKRIIGNPQVAGKPREKSAKAPSSFVLKSCYSGAAAQHSHGVSIYLPWVKEPEIFDQYANLNFCKITGWHEFLDSYFRVTEREMRPTTAKNPVKRPAVDNPLSSPILADFNSRMVEPADMGEGFKVPKVKNPPRFFFRDECKD